jgi:hypothetical protein
MSAFGTSSITILTSGFSASKSTIICLRTSPAGCSSVLWVMKRMLTGPAWITAGAAKTELCLAAVSPAPAATPAAAPVFRN